MQRPCRAGCAVDSDDPAAFRALADLHARGAIDHIQVLIVPEPEPLFRERLEMMADTGAEIVVHAPHHGQGVNPCAPAAFGALAPREAAAHIEHAMAQTAEAADVLQAETIVLHAGRYEEGGEEAAREEFASFLDRYLDPRMILENLPAVYAGYPLLGNTADDVTALAGGRVQGCCLDFAHLYCTANYLGSDYAAEVERFAALDVRLHHLSNSPRGSTRDRHLPLDHPDGGLPFDIVIPLIAARPGVQTCLELKGAAREYARQVAVFADLCRRYGR
ncbi:MAG: TIM barrel protein [Methanomicrobiaceae archaeon]|nr:TIM barrel protein [Methanomicrobiaceae archaeon]